MVTLVSMVWGDYDRFIPAWLGAFAALDDRADGIIIHGPTVDPTRWFTPNITWVPADPFNTEQNGSHLFDQVVRGISHGWVWPTAIDDFVTPAGITRLQEAPADAEFMLITAEHTDGSDRWDSDLRTVLGPASAYRMVGGCPFTVDLYRRAGPYANPPGWEITCEWGFFLRVLAADPVVFDGTGPVSQRNTKNVTGYGRTQLNVAEQEQRCREYAAHLGLT